MKDKRILAGITALILGILTPFYAMGDIVSRDTEENGKIKETVWEDENGQSAAGPDGYAAVRYTYDRQGNTIETYYDTEGNPYRVFGGYYGKRVQKDGKGNTTEIEFLDENGKRTLNRAGYGMITMAYFGFGAVRTVYFYGLKRPMTMPSLGYASIVYEYSNKTMTSRTYRDEKGNPVDCADGYAAVKQKLDKKFRVLSIRYEHADGKPATGPDGWFRCVKERDDKGRLLSVKYYDENEQLTDRGNAYAWEGYAYEGEDTVKVTRYDLGGIPVTDGAGVATIVRKMKDNQIMKESFLDKDGNPTTNSKAVGAIMYSYDLQGSLEKISYQDTEGNPVRCSDGYAGYRDVKNENGVTVSRTYLGTDGNPTEISGGYSEVRYVYDETGTLTTTQYFDLSGKQVQAE